MRKSTRRGYYTRVSAVYTPVVQLADIAIPKKIMVYVLERGVKYPWECLRYVKRKLSNLFLQCRLREIFMIISSNVGL